MLDGLIKLVIGDLEGKKEYRQMMKQVDALPEEYRIAFKKIQHYMYSVGAPGGDMTVFTDLSVFTGLIELFETSAADAKTILEITGSDVSKFADDFMAAYSTDTKTVRDKLNSEIAEYFGKEGKSHV